MAAGLVSTVARRLLQQSLAILGLDTVVAVAPFGIGLPFERRAHGRARCCGGLEQAQGLADGRLLSGDRMAARITGEIGKQEARHAIMSRCVAGEPMITVGKPLASRYRATRLTVW